MAPASLSSPFTGRGSPSTGQQSSYQGRNWSPEPAHTPEELAATAAMWKRRAQEFEQKAEENESKKRKQVSGSSSIKRLGRPIPKIVSLFADVRDLLAESDQHELRLCGEPDNFNGKADHEIEELKRSHARSYGAMTVLRSIIPNFQKKVDESEPDDLDDFYSQLQQGALAARGEDVSRLMKAVAEWINQTESLPGPHLDPTDRSGRGVKHNATGMLLCPINHDWDDLDIRAKLRAANDSDFDMTCNFLLRGLYSGFKGNMADPEHGYLRSALLVKTFKHIFTSPSSAADVCIIVGDVADDEDAENVVPEPPQKRRRTRRKQAGGQKSVAARMRMTEVTPRSIAYAVVQLVLACTNAEGWCMEHNGLDFSALYEFIIDFFETPKTEDKKKHRAALLLWWNSQVFPQSKAATAAANRNAKHESLKLLNG